jgi:hypothetical protein
MKHADSHEFPIMCLLYALDVNTIKVRYDFYGRQYNRGRRIFPLLLLNYIRSY